MTARWTAPPRRCPWYLVYVSRSLLEVGRGSRLRLRWRLRWRLLCCLPKRLTAVVHRRRTHRSEDAEMLGPLPSGPRRTGPGRQVTERCSVHDHSAPEFEGSPGHLITPRLVDAMHSADYMSLHCDAKAVTGIYVDGGGRAALTGRASRRHFSDLDNTAANGRAEQCAHLPARTPPATAVGAHILRTAVAR